ncbi:S1C family serine protease [Paenibacillus naphthalenovorans]|uniref:Peptidase A2 n=1 Tax=Paenibacillus naphthalenovorans TaxID=162209 RepID=A0A0U2UFL9_9BACL|nr:trypsin-like peptidase domain-containing protein [Paenibacillus naphthalenovorans]ALS20705.1 peptidase A2 [Paenibacillus naphthalenovorans]GCL70736.1 peptidase A2 [Paenibacillus naphthalenovorans]SDI24750.1 serine protease, S1-C subfamily, contains C-terminal PDZ domain [Paenibacillus naphthalenovorans]
MDNNNKNGNPLYDFFGRANDGSSHHKEQEIDDKQEMKEEKAADIERHSSHYFSYGPFKPGESAAARENAGSPPVEVTPPKPLRTYSFHSPEEPNITNGGMGNWQVGKPKRSGSFRTIFASFMAGVVVVGSLMFASDKMNLFTGAEGVMNSGGSNGSIPAASSNNGGVQPSALDISRPNSVSSIVQQASPAVVKIETKVKPKASSRTGNPFFDDPFFRQFFGDNGGQQPDSDQLQPGGMGTGFIFEKSGYILTNEHVIDGADEIWVYVQGYEKPFKAELLGNSYDLDLAALKIKGDKDFPTLPLGNADNLNVGDWVVAIGNPYGFDHTVTVGVLSAKERPISIPDTNGTREYKHLLQTDASINPGNSGGPLLNLNGEVVGINTAVSSQAQGIGFAIPTSTINAVLDNLKNNVEIPKEPAPYIGVRLGDVQKDWVADLKLPNTDGAIVSDVERRSPAFTAGIRPYDVIVEVNGAKVKTSAEAVSAIQKLKVGDKATIGVMRDGQKINIEVTIGDRNAQKQQ